MVQRHRLDRRDRQRVTAPPSQRPLCAGGSNCLAPASEGQAIHVTEGVRRAQQRGGAVEEIRADDTVVFEPGEWHWHGAAPATFMTHLALHEADEAGSDAEWGDHVTDAEYE